VGTDLHNNSRAKNSNYHLYETQAEFLNFSFYLIFSKAKLKNLATLKKCFYHWVE
jgi:hypothetical protein